MSDPMDEMAAFTKTWIAFHEARPDVGLTWFIQHYQDGVLVDLAQFKKLLDDLIESNESLCAEIETLKSQPVPAPRLEWQFYPDNGHFYDPRKPWNINIGRGDGTFADGTIGGNGDAHEARLTGSITVVCANVAAAKELAEKLEAVLSPPVGTQE